MHINDNLIALRRAEIREKRSSAIVMVCVLLFCALILFTRFFWLICVEVDGDSMCDTLTHGDLLLVNRLIEPERGDIIVFSLENKDYIKRVIAVGGDTIKLVDGHVFVKKAGENIFHKVEYQEKGDTLPRIYPIEENRELYVKSGTYYVLGDNRECSLDSRFFGCVPKQQVFGVVPKWAIDNRHTFLGKLYPYL